MMKPEFFAFLGTLFTSSAFKVDMFLIVVTFTQTLVSAVDKHKHTCLCVTTNNALSFFFHLNVHMQDASLKYETASADRSYFGIFKFRSYRR